MMKAFGFTVLFVVTNASLLLLYPLTPGRFLTAAAWYTAGTTVILFLLFNPRCGWLVPTQTQVPCGSRPAVALTFDDGPSTEVTPRVLAILRAAQVPATFFCIGRLVEEHPDLARRIVSEGHVIGNHTYAHPALFCFLTPGRLRREVRQAQVAIADATGQRPTLFRSPVGLRHGWLSLVLTRESLSLVLWQLRTLDTRATTPDALLARVLDRVRPGGIVLLHDRPGLGAEAMLEALPEIITQLKARGYEFVSVGRPAETELPV
jgi:peptidoglycan/xylan/chitin deacetylase (PgdA/CDA1 family)